MRPAKGDDYMRQRNRRNIVIAAVVAACLAIALAVAAVLSPGSPFSAAGANVAATHNGAPVGMAPQNLPEVSDAAAPRSRTVSVMMVGDVLVHRGVWESGESGGKRDYAHLFANIKADARAADIAIVNQETPLGGESLGLSGYPMFNGPQEIGDAEVAAGFNVVTRATNHSLDAGQRGIESELAFWRKRHPDTAVLGLADSKKAYDKIYVAEKNGMRVAVLNYTFSTNGIAFPSDNPYAVRMLDEDLIADDVSRARKEGKADVVIACPHWGTEYQETPDESQRRWAQVMADAGVDVIIGTHPHVIEPVETVKGSGGNRTLVFWSLGNFVSTQPTAQTMVGGMAKVDLRRDPDGTCHVASWELVPVVTQRLTGHDLTTYRLDAYTDKLASANGINAVQGSVSFSRKWVVDYCAQVLGDGFDRKSCVLRG